MKGKNMIGEEKGDSSRLAKGLPPYSSD